MTDPDSILLTGQRLIHDAVTKLPEGRRGAFVVLMDGDKTICAEFIHRVGDTWEFSAGFRKEWEQKPDLHFQVRASW